MSKIMKFWNVFLSVLVMAFVFAACSDDEPGGSDKNVPTAVTESFKKSFPEATNVAWKQSQGYYLASFNMKAKGAALAAQANKAWFLKDGTMNLSDVDVPMSVFESDVTYAKILATWKASVYFSDGYVISEVEVLTRNGSAAMIVKMEVKKGKQEYDLYFTLDGRLVKAVLDDDDDDDDDMPCPVELEKIVLQMYSGSVIIDFEMEDGGFEVTVLTKIGHITVKKELMFDKNNKFLYAEIEIEDKALAELIKKFFTPELISQIVAITGETNPAEWDFDIIEDAQGLCTIYIEDKNDKKVEWRKGINLHDYFN